MPEENRRPWSKKFENRCANHSATERGEEGKGSNEKGRGRKGEGDKGKVKRRESEEEREREGREVSVSVRLSMSSVCLSHSLLCCVCPYWDIG